MICMVTDGASANPVIDHEKNPIGYELGGGGVGRLDGVIELRLVNPPLFVLNDICPVPDGGGKVVVGAAYVIDTEDVVTSPTGSVALT